jgi:cell division protein FtsZ
MSLVAKGSDGQVNYEKLKKPAVMRQKASNGSYAAQDESNMDYYDIPAFLRRQAD